MTIEKLPSGSYRIKQMVDGKTYRLTIDHKPTKLEALKLISEQVDRETIGPDMTFGRACEVYIEQKSNVLSVSTISGYRRIMRQISPILTATRLSAVTSPMIQDEVNRYAADHSPKSVYNLSGFLVGICKYFDVDIKSPKLPQKETKAVYIPTAEEVKKIFEFLKGSKYEVPIMLAAMGLRRSEIVALEAPDLNGNVLTINKAKVQDSDGKWVIKAPKTPSSVRTVILSDYLADLIRQQGFYNGHPELIYRALTQAQDALGIQHFPLHKLRHFFASYMHNLGLTSAQIQDLGGWKTDAVMKTVYTHSMELDEAKQKAADMIGNLM